MAHRLKCHTPCLPEAAGPSKDLTTFLDDTTATGGASFVQRTIIHHGPLSESI